MKKFSKLTSSQTKNHEDPFRPSGGK